MKINEFQSEMRNLLLKFEEEQEEWGCGYVDYDMDLGDWLDLFMNYLKRNRHYEDYENEEEDEDNAS